MSLTTAKRFTIGEYHRLAELGFFEEDERVELIKGEIIQMAAKGTPHSVCETRLEQELYKLVGDRATLRGQQPITLSNNSEPEPHRGIAKNRDNDSYFSDCFFRLYLMSSSKLDNEYYELYQDCLDNYLSSFCI